jgi:predicted phosphate transport protein (TIGR00153 family)
MINFAPRKEPFFDLLEAAASNALDTVRALRDMVEDYREVEAKFERIRQMEHDGDRIAHEIFERLNKTFVTPLDREDIHALAMDLDDIVDGIEEVADHLLIYRIKEPTAMVIGMVRLLVRCCEEIAAAVPLLRGKRAAEISERVVEINRLENEGDQLYRAALEKLFDDPQNLLDVIRWKEVYEVVEKAIDSAEDIADRLHGILIKNA